MFPSFAQYREFAPCEALREHVRAFFRFGPPDGRATGGRRPVREVHLRKGDTVCPHAFADGHVSLVFNFERVCGRDGRWRHTFSAARGEAIGPMSGVGTASAEEEPEAVGVFLRAGRAQAFTGAPAGELADRVVALEDLWGADAAGLPGELAEAGEATCIDRLESIMLRRLARARREGTGLDVRGLADYVLRAQGRLRIEQLADAAGVSRQHLTRAFREAVGVGPKLFARLARFEAGLAYTGCGAGVDWAQAAVELGYADQSHMIAEFREFSGLTPETLVRRRLFHPFIERARWGGWAR